MLTPTVILAGGRAKPDLEALTGQSNRALIVVDGKPMLHHVLDAIVAAGAETGPLGPITVIGDLPDNPNYARLPDSGDFVANVFAGLTAHQDAPFVLLATADLPFLTGEVVAAFVRNAMALAAKTNSGMIYPIVPVSVCYARFPGIRRTALRLKEGKFTGGNLVLVRPQFLLSQRVQIAQAYAARKSPLRLAHMLGPGTVGRVLGSQIVSPRLLSVPQLEARISRLLGGPVNALWCEHAEIATDLDRPADFAAIKQQGLGIRD